jgi:hypothetical protein
MNLIATAIIAAIAKLADPMILDGYNALKSLLKGKLGPQSSAVEAVEKLEAKPESKARADVVREELAAAAELADPALLLAAQRLTDMLKGAQGGQQIVSQTVSGEGHTVVGIGDAHVQKST